MQTLNNFVADLSAKQKARCNNKHYVNQPVLCVGDLMAEHLAKISRSVWFTHFLGDTLHLAPGPDVDTIVFVYQADEPEVLKKFAQNIHTLSKTAIEMNIVLVKPKRNDEVWRKNKKECIDYAKALQVGCYVFNKKKGEARKLMNRILGRQGSDEEAAISERHEEDMDLATPPSSPTVSGRSTTSRGTSTAQSVINLMLIFGLLGMTNAAPIPFRIHRAILSAASERFMTQMKEYHRTMSTNMPTTLTSIASPFTESSTRNAFTTPTPTTQITWSPAWSTTPRPMTTSSTSPTTFYARTNEGTTTRATATWISADRQKALTFGEKPNIVIACDGTQIVLSEQNFGIRKDQYEVIMAAHVLKKRNVQPEQLASQLTAAQLATNAALSQLYIRECQRNIRVANPTLQARRLLNRENLQAKWVGESTVEIFPCIGIRLEDISYRPTKDCYKFIPITLHLPDTETPAFLDPEMRILSLSSLIASCAHFRYHHLQLHKSPNTWLRIDVITGKAQRLLPSAIHELYETAMNQSDSDLDLHPLTFQAWQLDNDTDVPSFPHIDEFANLQHFKDKLVQHTTERAEA